MRFAVVLSQVIGPHVNGSQVACWAVVRHLLRERHEVYVCSIIDREAIVQSADNIRQLEDIGARFHPIQYERGAFRKQTPPGFNGCLQKFRDVLCLGETEEYVPWLKLRDEARRRLNEVKPDAILCYDFDALAALHRVTRAPKMAVIVDLWHMAVWERWQVLRQSTSRVRRLVETLRHRRLVRLHRKLMMELLQDCAESIEFAPHHADWLRRRGLPDVQYLQTPVEDPLPECQNLRPQVSPKPVILMIGDLTNVATRLGMELFALDVLPKLEERLGVEGFEVRVVGGGRLPEPVARHLKRPSIRMIGRVSPPHSEFLRADLVLVPTPVEIGMRVRIAVAFGYGCCVVAHSANQAGIPEMIDEQNSLLGGDALSIARQIERACKETTLRKTLGRNARSTFEKYFLADRAAARLTDRLLRLGASNLSQQATIAK